MKNNGLIYMFALASHGDGISGGDRICLEFARHWSKKIDVCLCVWKEGREMAKRLGITETEKLVFKVSNMGVWCQMGFLICYVARIIAGVILGLTLRPNINEVKLIYSASEFWMDIIPAFLLKLRYPQLVWAASWYQTAPNPLTGFSEANRREVYRLSALLYWLVQLPVKPLIKHYADFILINNNSEKKHFKNIQEKRFIVVHGAVDVEQINKYKVSLSKKVQKRYDAVFQGRFHPQKGVVELIEIWRSVVDKKPNAQLVMIGDGPLMEKVKEVIVKLKLQKNVILKGYLFDGPEKYSLFSQSKLVVHPAFFDSGGMASAEAMIFELPCVGFDLQSYKDYYPLGMVKVKKGDIKEFSQSIIELLDSPTKREKIGKQAANMIQKNWSWQYRSNQVLSQIF